MLRTSMTLWQIQMQHHAKQLGPAPLVQVIKSLHRACPYLIFGGVGVKKHTLLSHTAT